VRIVNESQDAQAALGGHLARNTLANETDRTLRVSS
jgi:hypothetical protein